MRLFLFVKAADRWGYEYGQSVIGVGPLGVLALLRCFQRLQGFLTEHAEIVEGLAGWTTECLVLVEFFFLCCGATCHLSCPASYVRTSYCTGTYLKKFHNYVARPFWRAF